MPGVIVVGAGIAGVTAARTIRDGGVEVVVLDRGRRIGGRMASRTTEGRPVDTGASYFTVADPAFQAVVEDWQDRGLARPWTDTFRVTPDLAEKPGPMRWAAPRGLRGLVEALAAGLNVREQTVASVTPGPRVDGEDAELVVLAMPDPQARRLLDPAFDAELAVLDDPYEPVLALTAGWPDRTWADVAGVFVSDDPVLSWVADDGSRRGDGAAVLVAHSTPEFARQHLDAPEEAIPAMVAALTGALHIDGPPSTTAVQRWTFARPAGTREQSYFLGDAGIGLCGDGWSTKPRVEAAYLSGAALGAAVLDRLA